LLLRNENCRNRQNEQKQNEPQSKFHRAENTSSFESPSRTFCVAKCVKKTEIILKKTGYSSNTDGRLFRWLRHLEVSYRSADAESQPERLREYLEDEMTGPVYSYLADDHRRLEDALRRATSTADIIEPGAYMEFRAGLLRHIGMEEKILLPAAQAALGGKPLSVAAKLRLDHGALAALLVLTPTPAIVAAIRNILQSHNPLEEGPDGAYAECERLDGFNADEILIRLQNAKAVAMNPYCDTAVAVQSARDAVKRAGHDLHLT
jgi:hypothetical protein